MGRSKNILVADDSEGDFFMLRKAFDRAGFVHMLRRVRNGLEAVAYITGQPPFSDRSRWPFPDLLILDLNMPKLTGLDVIAFLRRRPHFKLPIIIISGCVFAAEEQRANWLGAAHCFAKPIDFEGLLALAQTVHDRWLSENNTKEPQPELKARTLKGTFPW